MRSQKMADEVFQWCQGTPPPWHKLFFNLSCKSARSMCQQDSGEMISTGADTERAGIFESYGNTGRVSACFVTVSEVSAE